jgi:hypothetical protein
MVTDQPPPLDTHGDPAAFAQYWALVSRLTLLVPMFLEGLVLRLLPGMMCHVQIDQFVDCLCKATSDSASGVHSALTGLWARMGVTWGEGGWGRAACVLEALSRLCRSNNDLLEVRKGEERFHWARGRRLQS